MPKIAVITDTHANLPALEAALAAIAVCGCEAIYHTGDALGIGPFPSEVLELLLHTPGMHLVMGNHDAYFGSGLPQPRPDWMDDDEVQHQMWTRAQVDPVLREQVAAWPYEITVDLVGVRMAFLHYPRVPGSRDFIPIVGDASSRDLDRIFAGQDADLVFYGHHHPAADHTGRTRYINPGALGCCREPLARFVVVDVEARRPPAITHHAVPYDQAAVFQAMEQRDMPARVVIRQCFFS